MKGKTIIIAIAALIVVSVFVMAFIPRGGQQYAREYSDATVTPTAGSQLQQGSGPGVAGAGGVQEATLSLDGFSYKVTPGTLKAGVPVRMTVDLNTVTGCTRDVVIPAFGVRKRVSPGDNVITFTPLQTGTIQMSCSMGMARGSFEVAAAAGENFQAVQAKQALPGGSGGGHTCGAGGGGCGCGSR